MAEVTVNRQRTIIMGSRRVNTYDIDIAADADTLTTPFKIIEAITAMGTGGNVIDASAISAGTVTWNTSGAEASVLVSITGL